jgi:L-lactate dehydrogenase complex protein LldE
MSSKIEVDIFIPCFVDQVYPETGMNMVKVLEKLGCKVYYNPNQTCCGQPAFNAGFHNHATEVANKFIDDFSNNRYIVAPSASCVGMVRNCYSDLVATSPNLIEYRNIQKNIFEFTEFLTDVLGVEAIPDAEFNAKVTYHDSCSALRECQIKDGPRKLLKSVKGLELVEMKGTDTCCGFGGTFAIKFEPISVAMGEQKVTNALETDAEYMVSTDVSCLMHLQGYISKNNKHLKTIHIADILAKNL